MNGGLARAPSTQTALVTGASSGLGAEFARRLAAQGRNLVLVARRRERLDALAEELAAAHGVRVDVFDRDLGVQGAATSLAFDLEARGIVVDLLVNNAGFGVQGDAVTMPLDRAQSMLQLNIVSLTELALVLGKGMAARGRGTILNVGSTASFQPTPFFAVYAATKAYVLSFSLALARELADRGVAVIALCPGGTRTEFFEAGGVHLDVPDAFFMSTERCVDIAMRAIARPKPLVVTGFLNRLMTWLARLGPLSLVTAIAGAVMRPRGPAKARG
jgi:short-subunit dehydrogenase